MIAGKLANREDHDHDYQPKRERDPHMRDRSAGNVIDPNCTAADEYKGKCPGQFCQRFFENTDIDHLEGEWTGQADPVSTGAITP